MSDLHLIQGHVLDVLRTLPPESVHCCVTSPPYWGLRAYGTPPQVWGGERDCAHVWGAELPGKRHRWGDLETLSEKQKSNRGSAANVAAMESPGGQFCQHCGAWRGELGLEPSLSLYLEHITEVFREVRRVLRRDGTCWINLGDCYAGTPNGWGNEKYRSRGIDDRTFRDKPFATVGNGLKPKDLCLMPARVAIALQEDGWWVRSDIIWHKPNCLPESIKDRPCKSHEYVYLLAKSEDYFYDHEAVKEPASSGKKKRASKRQVGPTRKHPGRNAADGRDKPQRAAREEYDPERVLHATRNRRTVWSITTQPYRKAHFACVDAETEVLTSTGWKRHGELAQWEIIAAWDPKFHAFTWSPATFHRYEFDGELVVIEKRDSSQRLTPNHRCPILGSNGDLRVVRADELKPKHQIPVAAPEFASEGEDGIGCDWAALVGWYIAEGHRTKDGAAWLYQSQSANPQHVERIRELLNAVGARYTERLRHRTWRGRPSDQVEWRVTREAADRMHELAPAKAMTPQLARLPQLEAEALLQALISGDGHSRADGRSCIIQKDKASIDLMQMLAIRLGYRAMIRPRGERDYALYLTRGQWLTLRDTNGRHTPLRTEPYCGVVWCPSVSTGFWLARRDGKPFITGNTYPEALVRPCIQAGTSEHGCCALCGAPYRRVVIKGEPNREQQRACGGDENGEWRGEAKKDYGRALAPPNGRPIQNGSHVKARILAGMRERVTTGWEPTCGCHPSFTGEPVPCVVLDPFAGSATTLKVAKDLGRSGIGIELQPEYLALAEERVR